MKYIYRIYQVIIGLPILIALTILTAVITMLCFPWKNSEWLHRIQMLWSKLCCWVMFLPVTISGEEHIQPRQSYVFVSNHQSMMDVFVIYGWLPVVFKWLMKQELRKILFVGTACKAAGHIFIDRRNPRAAQESIQNIKNVLVDGVSTVIFPEGTRTVTGQMGTFKRGAFQVAWDTKLPVIPISLSGCYQVLPKGKWFLHRHPMHIHIGEPIDLQQFEDIQSAIQYVREVVIKSVKE